MIKKLICLIWGHKTVHKAYTGEKMAVVGVLGNSYDISLYQYEKTDFCIRCGRSDLKGNIMDEIEKAAMLNCFWVDEKNLQANDSGPGTRDKPFASYEHALAVARRGIDLIFVVPPKNYSTKHMKELPEGMTDREYGKDMD